MTNNTKARSVHTGTRVSGAGLVSWLELERIYLDERDKREIAARMKTARKLAGYNEIEMGELLDPPVRDRSIRNYETGRVPLRYLRQWAEITGVSFNWILTGAGAGPSPEPVEPGEERSVIERVARIEKMLERLISLYEQDASQEETG